MVDYQTLSIMLTGIGMVIAFTYYALQIRNQNRTRQAQLLMQVYNRFDSPEKVISFNYVFDIEFRDFDEFQERWGKERNPEAYNHITSLITFSEGVGTLVKTGDLPIENVYTLMGGLTILLWEKFKPVKEQIRDYYNFPRWASETEYLYRELIKYEAEHPELKTIS